MLSYSTASMASAVSAGSSSSPATLSFNFTTFKSSEQMEQILLRRRKPDDYPNLPGRSLRLVLRFQYLQVMHT